MLYSKNGFVDKIVEKLRVMGIRDDFINKNIRIMLIMWINIYDNIIKMGESYQHISSKKIK